MPEFRFEPALPNAQAPDTHYNGTAETCQPGPQNRRKSCKFPFGAGSNEGGYAG
jgi:hypothetical protein